MLIQPGDKVHIVVRRLFEKDIRRHFIGEVQETDGALFRVTGYVFVVSPHTKQFERKPRKRTRVFSLHGANLLITLLPETVDLETTNYVLYEGRLVLSDGSNVLYDIDEYRME